MVFSLFMNWLFENHLSARVRIALLSATLFSLFAVPTLGVGNCEQADKATKVVNGRGVTGHLMNRR